MARPGTRRQSDWIHRTWSSWPQQLVRKWQVAVWAGDATPALVGGKLYVFVRQEGREVLVCLDAASGKQLWAEG